MTSKVLGAVWQVRRERLHAPRSCRVCAASFVPSNGQVYCSRACREGKLRVLRGGNGLPSGVVGAAHELMVCVDLLKLGWTVFRNVAPNGPADLVIMKGAITIRVEVTTGNRSASGLVMHPPKRAERYRFDVLAIVLHDGTLEYRPALP